MSLDESDKQRIAGRKWAEETIETAMDEGPDFLAGFVRQIRRVFAAELTANDPDVMTEEEAIAFEHEEVVFGKHKGFEWGEVDAKYIAWLADQNRPLNRYVRSERFKNRDQEG